jgi:hypothetical protein
MAERRNKQCSVAFQLASTRAVQPADQHSHSLTHSLYSLRFASPSDKHTASCYFWTQLRNASLSTDTCHFPCNTSAHEHTGAIRLHRTACLSGHVLRGGIFCSEATGHVLRGAIFCSETTKHVLPASRGTYCAAEYSAVRLHEQIKADLHSSCPVSIESILVICSVTTNQRT